MAPRKGTTNNPHGRPKGVPNKATKELKEFLTGFIHDNKETLQKKFDKLEPKDQLAFFEKLIPYVLPKMTASTIEATINNEERLRQLPDDKLAMLIDNIIEDAEEEELNQ